VVAQAEGGDGGASRDRGVLERLDGTKPLCRGYCLVRLLTWSWQPGGPRPDPAGPPFERMVASTEDSCSPTPVVAAPGNDSASARTRPQVGVDHDHPRIQFASTGRPMTWPCACGHPASDHDRTADRFCAATRAGQLLRGCICIPADNAVLDRLTGRERPQ
jgi:hypothetical protein